MEMKNILISELQNKNYDSDDDAEVIRKMFESSTSSDTDSSNEYDKPRRKLHRIKDYLHTIKEYDEIEFKQHFRIKSLTCNYIIDKVKEDNVIPTHTFSRKKISAEKAVYMTIWYLANLNTFREISDKFDVTQSAAHRTILTVVDYLVSKSLYYIHMKKIKGKLKVILKNYKELMEF
ncbi:hypothetical protein RN001_005915 [Aquatica leii]|uniref:Transposase Helix-turn-helix domain-containing protein n=1 Tax=Aquatica leii TaxID=1421715 RepID=A0AAN7PHP9_9COLE|nr:hypothetical protein RN001_005915 [Aquatica leii]